MKKIPNWSLVIMVALVILWGIYAFLFGWVVPKTASLTSPRKWNNIPLGQSKNIVHDYLGEPSVANQLRDPGTEQWSSGSKGKMYILTIRYVTDTIVGRYSIRYQYSNKFISRNYLIDSVGLE